MQPNPVPAVRKGYVDTRGGQIHYRHAEPWAGRAAPVLFFHRTPVSSASFERVLACLAGWRPLVAFDTPGFGESFTPPDAMAMADFTEAFAEAIASLGVEHCHLVGHHTGCHFATELAVQLGQRVLSLMIDGAMVSSAEERARVTPGAAAPEIDRDGAYARATWSFLQPYYTVFDPRCVHDEFVGALRTTFTRGACMRAVQAHDMSAALARVRCPVLASAAGDDVFSLHLERIRAVAPHAVLRRYGSAGIAAPELQTGAFADLVRESVGAGESAAGIG